MSVEHVIEALSELEGLADEPFSEETWEFIRDRETLMSRQAETIGEGLESVSAAIVGCGSVGSNVAHMMASLGVAAIQVVDNDFVGEENIFPSWYDERDVGRYKANALTDRLQRMGCFPVTTIGAIEMLPPDALHKTDFCVLSTDTLEARRATWERMLTKTDWFIDTRVGGPMGYVMFIPTSDVAALDYHYRHQLMGANVDTPCGLKANAALTKGIIPGMVGKGLVDISHGRTPPYMQVYNLDNGQLIVVESVPKMAQNGSN